MAMGIDIFAFSITYTIVVVLTSLLLKRYQGASN
jgi:hypothetical protein